MERLPLHSTRSITILKNEDSDGNEAEKIDSIIENVWDMQKLCYKDGESRQGFWREAVLKSEQSLATEIHIYS